MLSLLLQLIKALNAHQHPAQIAGAICLAAIAGLTPLWSFHNLIVPMLLFSLRINITFFMLAWGLFSSLSLLCAGLFSQAGQILLTASPLQDIWTAFYQTDIGKLSRFNNTLVMGSLAVTLCLCPPLFIFSHWLVTQYREVFIRWINRTPIVKALKASKWYQRAADVYSYSRG